MLKKPFEKSPIYMIQITFKQELLSQIKNLNFN